METNEQNLVDGRGEMRLLTQAANEAKALLEGAVDDAIAGADLGQIAAVIRANRDTFLAAARRALRSNAHAEAAAFIGLVLTTGHTHEALAPAATEGGE